MKQASFYAPADNKGKWHIAEPVTGTPICKAPVVMDTSGNVPIVYLATDNKWHPICCRRCIKSWQKNK